MREAILRDFFAGACDTAALAADLSDALVEVSPTETRRPIEDMRESFVVEPVHLARVCEAVLTQELAPDALRAIGFCLVASDSFLWDSETPAGARVAEVAHDWSAPEVHRPLTVPNVERWRAYLLDHLQVGEPASRRTNSGASAAVNE